MKGSDASSTGNMRRHAVVCWGEASVDAADAAGLTGAREAMAGGVMRTGSLPALYEKLKEKKKDGVVIYSHRQHTKAETR